MPAASFGAPATAPIALNVDAHDAPSGIAHVEEQIPVVPGPLTLVYPKWIPGEHQPSGPIVNVGGYTIRSGTTPVAWRRDLADPFAIHLTVPAGVTTLNVAFDIFGVAIGRDSSTRFATANMLNLTWHKVLLVPDIADYHTITVAPALRLPGADWQFATALQTQSRDGDRVTFTPVTMAHLVDSPLDAGTVARRWPLGSIDGAPVELAAFADTPDELQASEATIGKLRALVAQMQALYGARHFDHYTFLLTVSDVMPTDGIEHHQSSDNGTRGSFLADPESLITSGDLLPHEFNHSWNGKYRRPADLATPNLQVTMQDDLLWVYEGLTQYYGNVQAARSGLRTPQLWREKLALSYATFDNTTGRQTRPLQDTADAAAVLYRAVPAMSSARRGEDFYGESELMWLEADGIIRRLSAGRASLDTFARAFFGGKSTGPKLVTYTRPDIIAALQAVQPYDWSGFFEKRLTNIASHPPDPFTPGGWRIVFHPTRSTWERTAESVQNTFNAIYSIGVRGSNRDGTIADVIQGSPAATAGIAPGGKIVAINEVAVRGSLRAQLDPALILAQHGDGTIRLLVLQSGRYRDVTITYREGPRYPTLERIPNTPDLLDEAAKPLPR